MREVLLRFRHWLIKKLGGYTEQRIYNETNIIKTLRFSPIRISAKGSIDLLRRSYRHSVDAQKEFQKLKWEMVEVIVERMLEENAIILSCNDNLEDMVQIYRADVYIVPPKVAAWLEQNSPW